MPRNLAPGAGEHQPLQPGKSSETLMDENALLHTQEDYDTNIVRDSLLKVNELSENLRAGRALLDHSTHEDPRI